MYDTINILGRSFEEFMALFFCEIAHDDDYYDVIAYHLAKDYRPQLEGMLPLLSQKRLRSAIIGFGLVGSPESDERIITYLDHSDPTIIAASLDALRWTGVLEWEHVAKFLSHPSPFVRGATLRFARSRLGSNSIQLLLDALKDSDEIVKENALDELDGIADRSHVQWIMPLLQDPSAHVRQAAETLMANIDSAS